MSQVASLAHTTYNDETEQKNTCSHKMRITIFFAQVIFFVMLDLFLRHNCSFSFILIMIFFLQFVSCLFLDWISVWIWNQLPFVFPLLKLISNVMRLKVAKFQSSREYKDFISTLRFPLICMKELSFFAFSILISDILVTNFCTYPSFSD